MYAIIEDGGKQYRVCQGDVLNIETRALAQGQNTIKLEKILLVKDEEDTHVGTPVLSKAKVTAQITRLLKGPKLKMLKFRRRKNSSTLTGHRQKYLQVTITEISMDV